jgi:hypothetical protein
MIEFISQNPKLVQVTRDGAPIGWLNRTRNPFDADKTIWSGIVDSRVIRQDSLCAAKCQVHDFVEDKVEYDLTEAGRKALKEHGPMHRAKVRVAAARGVTELDNITFHFKLARALADNGETAKAIAHLEPLKDALLGVIDALNFAGISGQTETKSKVAAE